MMSETGEGNKGWAKNVLKNLCLIFLGKNLDKQTCYFFFRQQLPYLNSMVVCYSISL